MRILSRCTDIVVANINELLDRAENPEVMIAQVIREMEDDLAAARAHDIAQAGAISESEIKAARRNRELDRPREPSRTWPQALSGRRPRQCTPFHPAIERPSHPARHIAQAT